MFENKKDRLAPRHVFIGRLVRSTATGVAIVAVSLGVGMEGYHYFESMGWIDAFVNASMILSGMGPMGTLQTDGGKLFAGFYALYSGLALILAVGIVLAPVVHRFFHKFHIEMAKDNQ